MVPNYSFVQRDRDVSLRQSRALSGALTQAVRALMTWRRSIAVFCFAVLLATQVAAEDLSPLDVLWAKFPGGIPWKVDITGPDGKGNGSLELLITSDHASSCLGGMDDGFRVVFVRKDTLPPTMSVASYGVAKVTGDTIKIDLTGGVCDAYLLMGGTLAPDGSSTGDIYTFGMRGGHDVATYRAMVKREP